MERRDITYQEKLNELQLDIEHPNNSEQVFILVEGDSDIRLFRKLFNMDICNVERVPGGKRKVEECVGVFLEQGYVIGILDADFMHLSEEEYTIPNIFLTDYHDIEITMIAQEPVLNNLLSEYTDIARSQHVQLRDVLFTLIAPISLLKWLNDLEQLELKFTGFGFQDLLNFDQDLDMELYFNRVASKSLITEVNTYNELNDKLEILKKQQADLLQLTNGHDFLKTLSKFLNDHSPRARGLHHDNLATNLRVAFNIDIFKNTELYQQINYWASLNELEVYEN